VIRNLALLTTLSLVCLAMNGLLGGCPPAAAPDDGPGTQGDAGTGTGGDATVDGDGTTPTGDTDTPADSGAVPGELQVKAYTDSLGGAARSFPTGQTAPDDIDVNLTPLEYTVAFKRIVLKQVDEATREVLSEAEVLSTADALVVDLGNAAAADVLTAANLPAGTYNQVDIEVFYLDMTISTIYPGGESHDIPYRMVFENMGVLQQRDFLLWLDPAWMTGFDALSAAVTEAGWYWMERENPDHVLAVAGATEHPSFNVLDLFANDAFWSAEHKVLEGGRITPALEYDPAAGGVVTINFDVTGTFNFKDYHDATTTADGKWEIRRDAGIHPFPPNFQCAPEAPQAP